MRSGMLDGGVLALATVLAVALVATAGCLGAEDEPPQEPGGPDAGDGADGGTGGGADGTPRTLDWWLSDCTAAVAIVPVDEAALAEHLPEGFEPLSAAESLGLPPDARGDGALGFETFQCASASSLNGSVEDVGYGAVFAPVDPPDDLDHPDAEVLFYKWETLVADQARRELLADRGLPAVDGSTDLSDFQEIPTGYSFDVSVTLDGDSFRIFGSASDENEDFQEGFSFLEFQNGTDGYGMWLSVNNTAQDGRSGTGTVELPSGHWTADVVGSTEDQAYIVASPSVHFEEGEIRVP